MHDLQQQTTPCWHRAYLFTTAGSTAKGQHVVEFPDGIRDALQHVQQVITATIVNHAAYYSKNQRKAYQNC